MSTDVVGAPSEGAPILHAQHAPAEHDHSSHQPEATKQQSAPVFLHSPPDSNNAHKSDATDSELSDLDDEPMLEDTTLPSFPNAQDEILEEDIGEVTPDHWSGAVPVFKPSMYQFKDFKRFVRWATTSQLPRLANVFLNRWPRSTATA